MTGGEALALTPSDKDRSISKFLWSPDGKYIAFTSADEKSTEKKTRDLAKDDVQVYGEDWPFSRLRILDVQSSEVMTVAQDAEHVYDFAWMTDSQTLCYATQRTPEIDSVISEGTLFKSVSVNGSKRRTLGIFSQWALDMVCSKNNLFWKGPYDQDKTFSSLSLYRMSLDMGRAERIMFGLKDDVSWNANAICLSDDRLIVEVAEGLSDQLYLYEGGTKELLQVGPRAIHGWDVSFTGGFISIAVAASFPGSPTEVYAFINERSERLSKHGKKIEDLQYVRALPFNATARDATPLTGVLTMPSKPASQGPQPTIVLVKGGPAGHNALGFDIPEFSTAPYLASHGYTILCPNYRGSSGQGNAFSTGTYGHPGDKDYTDIIDLVREGIKQSLFDPERIAIGGWSWGGYLSYVSVVRSAEFHFKAAVCGAGTVDWVHSFCTSDTAVFPREFAGPIAPWECGPEDPYDRSGSPLWHLKGLEKKTPVLILHGENDARVHVSGARSFHRGCLANGVEVEMAIYPREGHGLTPPFERAHYVDMLSRMKRFYDRHLLN